MKTNYNTIKGLFTQKSLVDTMTLNIKSITFVDPLSKGEFSFWCWRYVFMKDVTKKHLTNQLLKLGLDNLTVVEVINNLNTTKELVVQILNDAKKG